jgi:hypothetical protein
MSLRYLKILLLGLALVFLSQACFPPPPFPYDRNDHHRHYRHRYGYSIQQSQKPIPQFAIQNGGKFSDQGEVVQ